MDPTHALYVLLDSNLPTGGFVASGGLESYAKHGFLRAQKKDPYADAVEAPRMDELVKHLHGPATSSSHHPRPVSAAPLGPSRVGPAVMHFTSAELDNFEASTGAYLVDAWGVVQRARSDGDIKRAVAELQALDDAHESTLLSHVARRASRAQGIAVLTLYARGLGPPVGFDPVPGLDSTGEGVVAAYRRAIRLGAPGHLAVCFGIVTAAVGLDLQTARHLYLFTHARSTLSAAVRLNIIGPYVSTQLLSYPVRSELAAVLARSRECPDAAPHSKQDAGVTGDPAEDSPPTPTDDWAWADEAERGPATTWPLGEILAARHDMQHSRIFNS